ncbi:MAG TPA: ABC transporter ATP-binding protein [Verrucomicrobiae bacterium]|nr:ABC transporter ATP-binding protein [Verrucomicrobiae bacterium]
MEALAYEEQDQSPRPILEVREVTLRYRTEEALVTAVEDVSFSLAEGDRVILVGPSGCGKSTLLKGVAGFLRPEKGKVLLAGEEVRRPGPERMVVFQEFDQLLPWKTVRENVAFALVSTGVPRREAEERALHWLKKVNLSRCTESYPHQLSGGMKQRVAIARCLAMNPRVVLMDEPFASLDPLTREKMQVELLALWEEVRFTMLFVTHSIEEAIVLGNRIVTLSSWPGRVQEEFDVTEAAARMDRAAFEELRSRIHRVLTRDVFDYSI